jgi:hypothetical protein
MTPSNQASGNQKPGTPNGVASEGGSAEAGTMMKTADLGIDHPVRADEVTPATSGMDPLKDQK